MQFTLEAQGTGSFLTYCMGEDDVIDSMSMGMVSNNHIEGIIPFQYLQMDNRRYLKYNISSKINLGQYFSGVVNRHRLLSVMESIASTVLNAEEYMLEPGVFVWDRDYIFVDANMAKAYMICLPLEITGRKGSVNVEQFFRQMLLSVQFDQSENCDYVARLLGFFNANTHFSLNDFERTLKSISTEAAGSNQYYHTYEQKSVEMPAHAVLQQEAVSQRKAVQEAALQQKVVPLPNPVSQPVLPEAPYGGSATPGQEKEKRGFSLFGNNGKPEKKKEEVKDNRKHSKKENKKEDKKTSKRAAAPSFGGIKIPGQDSMPIPAAPAAAPPSAPPQPQFQKQSAPQLSYPAPENNDADKTEIMDDGDVTEIVGADLDVRAAWLELISAAQPGAMPRIDLNINKPVITIGRMSSDAVKPDIAFPSSFKRIGRQHVRIEHRGTDYFVVDLGSVNHTLLNGQMLTPNQPYQLEDGMELTLTSSKTVQYRVHL